MITVVSWNIDRRLQAVEQLLVMDADVALLQEVGVGALDQLRNAEGDVTVSPQDPWAPWPREYYVSWPMVVKLSDRVKVDWFQHVLPAAPKETDNEMAVSIVGTIAAALITPLDKGQPFITASLYARWLTSRPLTGRPHIYSDAAAHRIMSDLSMFIADTDPDKHRILAVGDMNNIYGATEDNRLVWYERDRGVFDRMNVRGLEFMGPQHSAGRRAEPTPQGLPEDTRNVPTYHTRGGSPTTAENQLDYVFASRGFHGGVRVRALNDVAVWGSSDHCRLLIEVDG